jgi:lysozyme
MKISQAGLDLIKNFEGYHRKLPDGSCTAYLCPAGVPTLGWGATKGVKMGMVWSRAQAQQALENEIATFEAAVNRLVTVDINQNERDALISFAYNCGEGALARSSILKRLNAGDREGAARGFALWNRGGGRVLPGLVRRRAEEAALFRRPAEPSPEPDMPQAVDPPPAKPEGSRILAAASSGETVAVGAGLGGIGLSFADALGYGGQILPLVKSYGLEAFILVLLCLAAGFALVKHFRRQDHNEGKTVQ